MAMKEHMPYKADTTRLRSRTQNICFFISISVVSYFEANGQNHIHLRLIQVLKKTSNRTAENLPQENCEQRTMHALSEEFDPFELRRGRASSETTDLRTLEFGPD